MICKHCGKEVKDEKVKICPKCNIELHALSEKIAKEHLIYLNMTTQPTIIFSKIIGVYAHNVGGIEWGNIDVDKLDTVIASLKEKCPEIEVREFY